jgi:hypothetical protein
MSAFLFVFGRVTRHRLWRLLRLRLVVALAVDLWLEGECPEELCGG